MDYSVYKKEIEKRRENNIALKKAEAGLVSAIEDYTSLDNTFSQQLDESRNKLESMYEEYRYYDGNWPIVYTNTQINMFPFYQGETDDKCNPYFRMTAVKAGDPGISPIKADITRTDPSVYTRKRNYEKESVKRGEALTALNNYPDRTNEVTDTTYECVGAEGSTQTECENNGGTWTEITPTWLPEETAVGLLKTALNAWRSNIVDIRDRVYDSSMTIDYWNGVITHIDNVISLLPPEATYPNQTPDPTPELQSAIGTLKVDAGQATDNFVTNRLSDLSDLATKEEDKFFGLIGLRLHMVNGSFSKLMAAKKQMDTNSQLIKDNKEAILSLTDMIIS